MNFPPAWFDTRRRLAMILLLAFSCRAALLLAVWHHDEWALRNDSPTYLALAVSMVHEGTFWYDGQPELMRTPGYPAFLVLGGVRSPLHFGGAQILEVLLGVAWVLLTYLLAEALVGSPAALWAALLHALSAAPVAYSVLVLSDGLFSLLITAALLLLVRHFRDRTWTSLAGAVVVTAAAAYTRPVGFLLVPAVVVVLLFRPRGLVKAAVFAGCFAVLVAPWFARNYLEAGYVGFSSLSDHYLLRYEAAGVMAASRGVSAQAARDQLLHDYKAELERRGIRFDSAPAMQVARGMGRGWILAHPLLFVKVHLVTSLGSLLPSVDLLQTMGITRQGTGTLSVLQSQGLGAAIDHYFGGDKKALLLAVPSTLLLGVQYVAGLGFVLWNVRRRGMRWGRAGWLAAFLIIGFIGTTGPAAEPRFRLPLESLFDTAAGAGLVLLAGWKTRANRSQQA